MLRLLLAALFLLVCSPALAGPVCQTLEATITELKPLADKMHGELIELTPAETAPYLEVVDAFPPVSHTKADSLLLFSVAERATIIIAIRSGCATLAGRVAASLHDKALKAARGEPT